MKHIDNDSGFKWGPFELRGKEPWRLTTEQKGGSVVYPYAVGTPKVSQHCRSVDQQHSIIHKGNHFSDFTHPRDYLDTTDWFWWDNCLWPQLMDMTRDKQWTRMVYRGCFPDQIHSDPESTALRLEQIEQISGQAVHKIMQCAPSRSDGRRVLWLQPNPNPLQHYYATSQQAVKAVLEQACEQQGLQLTTRFKQGRTQRQQDPLTAVLEEPWHSVITMHSAATAEVVCAGLPCVQLGQGAYPRETMRFTQWSGGEVWVAPLEQRQQRTLALAATVWHKQELLEGTWQPKLVRTQTPQTKWSIYD